MIEVHSLHFLMPNLHNAANQTASAIVKLGAIDLNLLAVFDAVMQERNVTRAGVRLGLSQTALSHALSRLRFLLKDELFVRSPAGMVPTPRAEYLAPPIRAAVDGFMRSLEPIHFDPATAQTHFRIAANNYAAIVMVAPLVARIGKLAPAVTLEFRPSGTLDIADLLDRGALDLAIGADADVDVASRFSRQPLLQDEFVAVQRKSHPSARMQALTIEKLAALPNLEISSIHHATDFIDDALSRRKLERTIPLRAPFLSAGRILETIDLVCVLPKRIAQELIHHRMLAMRPILFSSPAIETIMVWPRRLENQPAHRWLRETIAFVSASLRSK
jgi:DNA-binding transcriptional LysR family regulator